MKRLVEKVERVRFQGGKEREGDQERELPTRRRRRLFGKAVAASTVPNELGGIWQIPSIRCRFKSFPAVFEGKGAHGASEAFTVGLRRACEGSCLWLSLGTGWVGRGVLSGTARSALESTLPVVKSSG